MRRDGSAVQHHQRARKMESDASAAERTARIVNLIEPVEDAFQFFRCNAITAVGNLQGEGVLLAVEFHCYPSSVGHILISIAQHVHHNLVECHAVDVGI